MCRERTQGCGPHQHGAGRINPEFCNHCTAARQADHLRCTVSRNHCEAAMRRCFEEGGAGGAGPQGTLRWLSFWDENAYDPAEFLGWANFGFSGNVSRICEGAAAGMRHMLKVAPLPPRHGLAAAPAPPTKEGELLAGGCVSGR